MKSCIFCNWSEDILNNITGMQSIPQIGNDEKSESPLELEVDHEYN
jgi:hypothetical protein